MTGFFSALNPFASTSGVTFRATGKNYYPPLLQQEMPDLTLDLVIPFLWSQDLSILEGIRETFTVFYGDHFDKEGLGFGKKGLLDFTIAPLVARKLIADTYLDKQKGQYLWNSFAWTLALPIKAIDFTVAAACTIALIPVIVVVSLLRALWNYFFPPGGSGGPGNENNPCHCDPCCNYPGPNNGPDGPPPPGAGAATMMMRLPLPTATAALFEVTRYLERADLRTPQNLRRLFATPHHMALVYTLERVAHTYDEEARQVLDQQVFNYILDNWTVFTNYQTMDYLETHFPMGRDLRLEDLEGVVLQHTELLRYEAQNRVNVRVTQTRVQRNQNAAFNGRQSTHNASVHFSTSRSAARLQKLYGNTERCINFSAFTNRFAADISSRIRQYDSALVGNRSDEEIQTSILSCVQRLSQATYHDGASNLTLPQLLELSLEAARDPDQWRAGVTEETPLGCLYAALYEIDREYSLSDAGIDTGAMKNAQSCEGGAFNKLIEALSKIHKACEVNFITPATAALKLPCVVRSVLKQYVVDHPDLSVETLQSEGIGGIWSDMQPAIMEAMHRDFASLYPNIKSDYNPNLVALVDAGQDVELTDYLKHLSTTLGRHSSLAVGSSKQHEEQKMISMMN